MTQQEIYAALASGEIITDQTNYFKFIDSVLSIKSDAKWIATTFNFGINPEKYQIYYQPKWYENASKNNPILAYAKLTDQLECTPVFIVGYKDGSFIDVNNIYWQFAQPMDHIDVDNFIYKHIDI